MTNIVYIGMYCQYYTRQLTYWAG